jgi:succinate-acetate transporter protein
MAKKQSLKMENTPQPEHTKTTIRKFGVGFINLYEITESDLEIIERGSNNLIYLNLCIFLVSVACSFLIAILTCDFNKTPITFVIFTIVTVLFFVLGLVLFILWYGTKNDIKEILKKIKGRSA